MTEKDWKDKASERRIENKMLKKRVKEITTGRDKWKEKAMERKDEITALKRQTELIKKNIQKIINA